MVTDILKTLLAEPSRAEAATRILLVAEDRLEEALSSLPAARRSWARRNGFAGRTKDLLTLPDDAGGPALVLAGAGAGARPSIAPGALARRLPAGDYRFDFRFAPAVDAGLATLGWLLSAYAFDRYRRVGDEAGGKGPAARLVPPEGVAMDSLLQQAAAIWLGRDLVNTPANDLGPAELALQVKAVAEEFGAEFREIADDELKRHWPLVHAVGRGAEKARAPRLAELRWGEKGPRVSLVGKGVCFDTGGLDIKPSSAMLLMKKDMGGAATALACARMIMAAGLPVRLRLLIPAVENAVSGEAFRPGDVLPSRKGLTVEIGNTDAEGRLILADALCAADEEAPDLLVDFATLTGAARVALGPALPAMFATDDALAARLQDLGMQRDDPMWRLPLWEPYREALKSDVADLNNVTSNGFAGSITAALFLSRFVEHARAWVHLDIYGWNPQAEPGRPKGGEIQCARAVFHLIAEHVAS